MPRRPDPRNHGPVIFTRGASHWHGNPAWCHPWSVTNCLCPDGQRRTVRLNQQPDTAFTWPGRASVNGRTTRGYIAAVPYDHPSHEAGEVMFYPAERQP